MNALTRVMAVAQRLFPPAVAVGGARIAADLPALFPGEEAGGPRVVPARAAEFAAGRAAARGAMLTLGHPAQGVPRGADRAPVWPAGLAGSISHANGLALAAVTEGALSPGIDLEEDVALPAEVIPAILTPGERAALALLPDPARLARLIFSAKEAAFKAQYPISRQMLGFDAAEVSFDAPFRLGLVFLRDAGPFRAGTRFSGRYGFTGGMMVTAFTVKRDIA